MIDAGSRKVKYASDMRRSTIICGAVASNSDDLPVSRKPRRKRGRRKPPRESGPSFGSSGKNYRFRQFWHPRTIRRSSGIVEVDKVDR